MEKTAAPNSWETSCEISLHLKIPIAKLIWKIPLLPDELAGELPVLPQNFVEHTILFEEIVFMNQYSPMKRFSMRKFLVIINSQL